MEVVWNYLIKCPGHSVMTNQSIIASIKLVSVIPNVVIISKSIDENETMLPETISYS